MRQCNAEHRDLIILSDPSALLLLKCGIPCHKNSAKLHQWNISVLKLGYGADGSARACSVPTVNAYFKFCCFKVESSVY